MVAAALHMQRATQTASVFAMASVMGLALATTRCWGEPFTETPAIGGSGGVAGTGSNLATGVTGVTGVTGTTAVNGGNGTSSGLTDISGGAGGTLGVDGVSATSTTGAAGEGPIPSPYGDNCQQVPLSAAADSYIHGMFPTDNYDYRALGPDRLEVSQYGNASKRTLLQFKLGPESAPGYTIAAAFLQLQVLTADSYGTLNLHRLEAGPWEERVVNWNEFTSGQAWTTPGGDFAAEPFASVALGPAAEGQLAVWDVTTEVQAMFAGTQSHGWMLKEAGEPLDAKYLEFAFAGRDTMTDGEQGPTLVVHFCK